MGDVEQPRVNVETGLLQRLGGGGPLLRIPTSEHDAMSALRQRAARLEAHATIRARDNGDAQSSAHAAERYWTILDARFILGAPCPQS